MTLKNAREMRKNATECERLLWSQLRAHRLQGFKFKRQQPIGPYIVDFVCFEARCIIEADGGHHSEQAEYDAQRDNWLRSQGFTVLRFWNNDILSNTDGVVERIFEVCRELARSPSPQPLPRRGGGAKRRALIDGLCATASGAVASGNHAGGKGDASNLSREAISSPLPSWDDCMDAGGSATQGAIAGRGRGRGGDGL
jgi:very-short-patch-repair endonuclease